MRFHVKIERIEADGTKQTAMDEECEGLCVNLTDGNTDHVYIEGALHAHALGNLYAKMYDHAIRRGCIYSELRETEKGLIQAAWRCRTKRKEAGWIRDLWK